MATMEAIEGKGESSGQPLPTISALDKIIVAFAGPLFSFLLALVFAIVVMVVGRPVSESEKTTVIGYVEKGGPADKAGLRPGDRILAVRDEPISSLASLWRRVWASGSAGAEVVLQVAREKETMQVHIPSADRWRLLKAPLLH